MSGIKEVGVRLKVGADGTENLDKLATALRGLGVNTEELDRKAEQLSAELVKTGDAGADAAIDQDKLAAAAAEAAKEADELARAAQEAATGTGELGSRSDEAKKKLGDMKLELAAAGAAAYTIGRALGAAGKTASEFETAMAEVSTLVSDTSGLAAQGDAVRALAREFGGDAAANGKALYQLISGGAKQGAESTALLREANKLAVAGLADLGTSATGLVGTMNAYGKSVGDAGSVNDAFFVAVKAGQTTIGELVGSIGQVAPIAAQSGVKLEELLSAVAALTAGGVKTSEAMTQVRSVITSVIKPTEEAQRTARALGLQFDAQALASKDLSGFLADVREKTGGNVAVMGKLFGSVEAINGVLALTGSQADKFADTLQAQTNRAGETDEAFRKISETSAFAARQFSSAVKDVQISFGQALTALTPVLQRITEAINLFNELPGPVKSTAAAIAGIGLAVVPVIGIVGSLTRAVRLVGEALFAKRAAALAIVGPMTGAAGATTALGRAAAGAAGPVGAAATAVGLLGRALSALKLLGIVGIALTVVELATGLFGLFKSSKDAAKGAEEAAEGIDEVGKAAEAASEPVQRLAGEAERAAEQTENAATKARVAAVALGVDLAQGARSASVEFLGTINKLDDLIGGLDDLAKQGVDTGRIVTQAFEKIIDGAKNQAELDLLKARIQALGEAGQISEEQLTKLMESIEAQAKKASGEVDKLADAYKKLGVTSEAELKKIAEDNRKAWELVSKDATASIATKQAAFERYAKSAIAANGGVASSTIEAQAAALGLSKVVDGIGDAYQRLGVKARDELRKIAEQSAKDYALIARDATASLATKQQAFKRYADNALAANGGVVTSTLEAQAKAVGMAFEFDKAGKVIVRSLAEATQAAGELKQETEAVGKAALEAARGFGLLSSEYQKARNARVSDNALQNTIGEHIRNTPSGGITRTVQTGQAVNKPAGDGWYYTTNPYEVQQRGLDARGNPLPGGWARDRNRTLAPGELGIGSRPPAGATVNGNAGFSPFGIAAPAAPPSQVVEVRFPRPSGGYIPATVPNQDLARELVAVLQEEYMRWGGR